jgi:hypothetical protein
MMGLFDFLKSKKSGGQDNGPVIDKNVQRLARVISDKHAQNYDRMEAIQEAAGLGSASSAAALLRRFTYYVEPSITDQEEKEVAFRGVIAAGENAIQPIRDFCVRAESLTYPMKILQEILPEDRYVDELLVVLKRFDTDYIKNAEPKVQLIAALEGRKRPDVLETVEQFLEDFDEPVRFHAVSCVFAQESESSVVAVCRTLIGEESVRVKNRIGDGLMTRNWTIPNELRADVARTLSSGYRLDGELVKKAH